MNVQFSDFAATAKNYHHHALMLVSKHFAKECLSEKQFHILLKELCGLSLYKGNEASAYDVAATHSDVFIADRQRKILRLEDLAKIKELCLYPPAEASRRCIYIENCERMNVNAANALLKVLEEPCAQVLFLLTTPSVSLVMPTIASRTQKIFVQFEELKEQTFLSAVSSDDFAFIKTQIQSFQPESYFISDSFCNKAGKSVPSVKVKEIIVRSEKLAKEYSADILRAVILFCLSEELKKRPELLPLSKFVLANISDWKNNEAFNLSTQLWLNRIFLGF